jgi:hypothetical protein
LADFVGAKAPTPSCHTESKAATPKDFFMR